MKSAGLVVFIAALLSGCFESSNTVTYYMENPKERAEKIAYCKESADREESVDCINAASAHARAFLKKGYIER